MNIGLALNTSSEFRNQTDDLITLSEKMEDYFKDKEYGEDLKMVVIGTKLLSAQFASFYKPKKPKYISGKRVLKIEDTDYEIENALEYEVRLNAEKALDKDFLKYVASEILTSLFIIDDIKKIKNFDRKAFSNDMQQFFIKEHLMETR